MSLGTPERVPPHSQECERALLGAILADNSAMDKCVGLSDHDFFDPIHRLIFSACRRRIEKGRLADALTLKEALADGGALDEVGGHKYLVQLIGCMISPKHVEPYVEKIRECAALRRSIAIFEQGIARAYTPTAEGDDAADAIKTVMASLEAEAATVGMGRPHTMGDAVAAAVAQSNAAHRGDKRALGIMTGLEPLDTMWCGMHDGGLDILAARSGTGKSALMMQIARHVAAHYGPVGIYSGEMTATDCGFFNLSSATRIPVDELRQGRYPIERGGDIIKAQAALSKLPIHIMDTPAMPLSELVAALRALKRQHDIRLAMVDHRDLIGRDQGWESAVEFLWYRKLTPALKAAAKAIGIPILLLVQIGRESLRREDKRPVISDILYTGEADADNIVLIHRPELYEQPPRQEKRESDQDYSERYWRWECRMKQEAGLVEATFAKRRFGPTGNARLRFHGPSLTFGEFQLRQ